MTDTKQRLEPIRAFKAFQKLYADKEDTEQVFHIIDALSTGKERNGFMRFERTAGGVRLLKQKPDLIAALNDYDTLKTLPEGTLGRTYYKFMSSEQLTADGLVDASNIDRKGEELRDEDQQYYGSRVRDQHDLWHVLTGYGRDPLGELCLLAFSYAQTGTLGIGFIVAMATFSMSREISSQYPIRQAVWEGYRLGKRAKWLPGTEWEDMLSMPLDELRAKLRVGKPAIYRETLNQFASDHPAEEPFAQAA